MQHGDSSLAFVRGPERTRAVATLLQHLAARERERKALGAEVLHLYREINLIYSFSEKLAALLDLERVAALTLQEARHLIVATDGVIMLLDEASGALTSVAGFGDELTRLEGFTRGHGIVGAVAETGIGELVNDIDADPRRVASQTALRGLLCAPMKVGERTIGVIALGSTVPMAVHGGGAEAAQHAGAADGDRDRERAAVRAHDSGGAGARAAAGDAPGRRAGAGQA